MKKTSGSKSAKAAEKATADKKAKARSAKSKDKSTTASKAKPASKSKTTAASTKGSTSKAGKSKAASSKTSTTSKSKPSTTAKSKTATTAKSKTATAKSKTTTTAKSKTATAKSKTATAKSKTTAATSKTPAGTSKTSSSKSTAPASATRTASKGAKVGKAGSKPKSKAASEAPSADSKLMTNHVNGTSEPPPVRPGEEGYSDALRHLVEVGRTRMGIRALRPGQAEALEQVLLERDVLAVMPTGSGKSLLYQLPSLVLPGITVVVSPLIALIKDQIDKMEALGVAVARMDSTLTIKQKRAMQALVQAPGGKLLLTTPERMADPEFRQFLRESASGVGVSLFVVDEAHCVSQWGHDFRPAYLVLRKALEDLGRPPVLATTATAPPHVREDILHQLGMPGEGGQVEVITTTFDRPNLHYEVIAMPGDDDKNRTLVTLLKKLPRPGIVYCATVKKVEELHEALSRHAIPVAKYHGRMTKNERTAQQQAFMAAKSELVMIATNAFGLGVDKRDIRNVLHYHVPGSLEAYAQEAGRGGRDGKPARCVLLFSPDDVAIQEFFLKGTYPTRRQVRAVFKALQAWGDSDGEPPTLPNLALGARVGVSRTRTVLSLLKDEGFVVEKEGGLFSLSEPPPDERALNEKAKQYEARRIADRQRLDALLDYVRTPGCRSQVILSYLGEIDPPPCGRCDNCLRSKEAALAAAREATILEDGVIRQLREEDQEEEDAAAKSRRQVRTRLIRIDAPPAEAEGAMAQPAAPAPAAPAAAMAGSAELDRLIAEQSVDQAGEPQPAVPAPAAADEYLEDEDEYGDDEDDDEYEYVDDDEEDDDDYEYVDEYDDDYEVEAIDKTAAALAEEGVELEDSEITVLARKKQPKPPRKKRGQEMVEGEGPPGKRKRRRRKRRRKSALPPKSAYTTPVLVREAGEAPPNKAPRPAPRGAGPGPMVEYVRGPLRINMTPVASATPNDVAPGRNKRRRKRNGAAPPRQVVATGSGQQAGGAAGQPSPPAGAQQPGSGKKRRRRRRRKRGGGGAGGETGSNVDMSTPVDFFSSGSGGPTNSNGQRKRRRRRRRGRGGRGNNPNPNPTPPSSNDE